MFENRRKRNYFELKQLRNHKISQNNHLQNINDFPTQNPTISHYSLLIEQMHHFLFPDLYHQILDDNAHHILEQFQSLNRLIWRDRNAETHLVRVGIE